MMRKACKNCHQIVDGKVCPGCKGTSFSNDWTGYVVVIDPENSEIAKRLNITTPGKYALRVR